MYNYDRRIATELLPRDVKAKTAGRNDPDFRKVEQALTQGYLKGGFGAMMRAAYRLEGSVDNRYIEGILNEIDRNKGIGGVSMPLTRGDSFLLQNYRNDLRKDLY